MARTPRTIDEQLDLARNSLAQGFTTKVAKKNAAFFVQCAFDQVREQFRQIGCAEAGDKRWYDMPQEWRALHDAMPYSCAHWSAKVALKLAVYQTIVAEADKCAALRREIMATPVVKPTTRPRTPAQMAKDAKARTCQICGRPIFAEVGVVAHHGYQRPGDGWQTDSCFGARHLPYEADKAVLVEWIGIVQRQLDAQREARADVAAERMAIAISYQTPRMANGRRVYHGSSAVYDDHSFQVTRATVDEVKAAHPEYFSYSAGHFYGVAAGGEFDAMLKRDLHAKDMGIKSTAEHLEWQQRRERAWVALERWAGSAWANV